MSYEITVGVEQYELPGMPAEAEVALSGTATAVMERTVPDRLPDIDETPPFTEKDLTFLHKMAALMIEEGIEPSRLIVQLGHQHFDIAPDETLLEEVDPEARVLMTRVVKRDSLDPAQTVATTLRMDDLPHDVDALRALMTCYANCIKGELYGHRHIHTSKPT